MKVKNLQVGVEYLHSESNNWATGTGTVSKVKVLSTELVFEQFRYSMSSVETTTIDGVKYSHYATTSHGSGARGVLVSTGRVRGDGTIWAFVARTQDLRGLYEPSMQRREQALAEQRKERDEKNRQRHAFYLRTDAVNKQINDLLGRTVYVHGDPYDTMTRVTLPISALEGLIRLAQGNQG